jgi:hypothetical protein
MGPARLREAPGDHPTGFSALTRPGARDVVLSPAAAACLEELEASPENEGKSIARRARGLRNILLEDCLHGEVVRKAAIPRVLANQYGLENLFVEDLPSFWRLLYTIVHEGADRLIVVVEIVDHRKYDRWFPNRGR